MTKGRHPVQTQTECGSVPFPSTNPGLLEGERADGWSLRPRTFKHPTPQVNELILSVFYSRGTRQNRAPFMTRAARRPHWHPSRDTTSIRALKSGAVSQPLPTLYTSSARRVVDESPMHTGFSAASAACGFCTSHGEMNFSKNQRHNIWNYQAAILVYKQLVRMHDESVYSQTCPM